MAYLTQLCNILMAAGANIQAWDTGFWGSIIGWFTNGIGSYGWAIIVFTIVLKLVMSPLEFMQRRTANKNSEVQKKMQPELIKLQKKYGNNKQAINQKQMELYKKYNYNVVGSCLVMLINLALTLTVFFTLFASLNSIAAIKVANQYEALRYTYTQAIEQGKTEEDAHDLVYESYKKDGKESWLWIDNIWKGDVATSIVPTFDEYVELSKTTFEGTDEEKAAKRESLKAEYNLIMDDVASRESGVNGYYVLVILAAAITFLSAWITGGRKKLFNFKGKSKQEISQANAQDPAAATNSIMMFVLPIIMIIFCLTSSAVFSLYILTNSLFTLAISPLYKIIINALDKKKEKKDADSITCDYKIQKETISSNKNNKTDKITNSVDNCSKSNIDKNKKNSSNNKKVKLNNVDNKNAEKTDVVETVLSDTNKTENDIKQENIGQNNSNEDKE